MCRPSILRGCCGRGKVRAVDVPCPDLLMQLSDDQFLHILSMISLRGLVSLRIISKSTTDRIDELCLQIPGFAARLFAYVRSTHGFLELPLEKLLSMLRNPMLTLSTAEVLESAVVWANHDPDSRLSLRPLLYDAVCLALLSPAVLADLAGSTGEGVALELINAAMELQNDPARRPQLAREREERSRPGDKIAVTVTYNSRLFVLDPTSLSFNAVVGMAPLDFHYYGVATYGGMIIIAGGENSQGCGAVHRPAVALLVGPATAVPGSGRGLCGGRGRLSLRLRGPQHQRVRGPR